MERQRSARRHRAFGLISYITPVAVPIFIVLFYAPFVAVPLQVHGWSKLSALGVGLLVPIFWLVIGSIITRTLPARFAKLKEALGWILYGLPILGMFVVAFGQMAVVLWHLAR